MKKLFFIFVLTMLPMSADMQYNKTNRCFSSNILLSNIEQFEYNNLVNMFLNGLISYEKNHREIQDDINARFGSSGGKIIDTPADYNQYFVIFINSLMSRKTSAATALLYDLTQSKTFELLKDALANLGQ